MNTQTIQQFDVLDAEMLAGIEGGGWWPSWDEIWKGFKCVAGTAGSTGLGALAESPVLGGLSGFGVGIATFC
ncbi:Blp family class II bacteriocin [Streptococcus dentapri]|uniref:Blp family class II bacteriocin n=1 Tax=Streptococcus dentapri TaxID=573564 RepID=A0ABV8D2S5_9STRE